MVNLIRCEVVRVAGFLTLFDNIRNETEFQAIVRDLESKYQAEHERVKKWLLEQGTL